MSTTSDTAHAPLGDGEELPPLPHLRPLSDRDRDMLLAVLDNPPEPNEALKKLMAQPPLS
jgi:hypothetical protein